MQIEGQGYFDLQIQEYSNFVKTDDVIAFMMKENCGAAGVLFEMSLRVTNKKISDLIIENNEVVFKIGETIENAKSYKAYITEVPLKDTDSSNSYIMVSFIASSIDLQFYTTRASETIFGTSLDVIEKMAKEYLGTEVDAQIEKPTEVEHNWLRSYETGAVTMLEAWLHMNLPNTTPLLWIDTNNIVHIRDIETIKKEGPKYTFIPADDPTDGKQDVIKYLNSFSTESYKFDTNVVTGENTIVNISNVENGNDTVHIPENKPDIASTEVVEKGTVGNKVVDNKYQTDNVHNKFMACYYTNKLRLIRLSSHVGTLNLVGIYDKINICDLVNVTGCDQNYSGRYIVNTKVIRFGLNSPVQTIVVVCRDNTNSIENSDITPKSKVIVTNQQMTDILQSIRTLRRATVMGTRLLDGTTKGQILGYCKSFKYNALNSFQVMGTPLNLNSSLEIMNSLKCIGNNIINNLIDKYIPYPYNIMLHNLLFEGLSFKKLLSQLFYKYAPDFLRELLIEIIGLLAELTNLANVLHKQNSKLLSDYNYVSGGYSAPTDSGDNTGNASGSPTTKEENIPTGDKDVSKDYTEENSKKIEDITDKIIDNVDGIDIPVPPIHLDESESLLPTDKLKELIANKIVDYLNGQGYLLGIGKQAFLAILMGRKPLDFNTIKLINSNVGNMLYARFWGTYNGEVTELGKVENISNKLIEIPDVNVTDDLFNGDLIIISGTDNSNGTYTVVSVNYDSLNNKSVVSVLEEINSYVDSPMRTYTTLCDVKKIVNNVNIDGYEGVSAIYIDGNYLRFLPVGLSINITKAGSNGANVILANNYDNVNNETVVYVNNRFAPTGLNQQLQVVVETESGAKVSKLSNQTLTEYYIKNGFKDIYSTVPCTKTINAMRGAKVWISVPSLEENIEFYINSKKVEMDVIEGIDLGMYAIGGSKLWYNVYLSKEEYNSNNVTLEIRRKQ